MNSRIEKILYKLKANNEFEVRFNYREKSLTIDTFQSILRKMKEVHKEEGKELKLNSELDISYNYKSGSFDTYRLTISGLENINEITKVYANKPSNITFSLLTAKIPKNASYKLISKEKDKYKQDTFDEEDFNIRCRLAEETVVQPTKNLLNLSEMERVNISYRFKNRVSLILFVDDSVSISVDLTSVKGSKSLIKLGTEVNNYELELEIFKHNDKPLNETVVKLYIDYVNKILGWVNKTTYVMSKTEKEQVLSSYKELVGSRDIIKLYSMQPETLNLPQLTDKLANNYAVTDKADGEKCGLYTLNGKVYRISNNLDVVFTGIENKSIENNTLAEGEYLSEGENIMLFDIMYFAGNDLRSLNLKNRLIKLDELVKLLNPSSFNFEEFQKENINVKELEAFYVKQVKSFVDYLNSKKPKIERKFFLLSLGVDSSEIFRYSMILWKEMKNVYYKLDGIIYTGLSQKYTTNKREIEFPQLKWKPQELNTIDMFIKFERNETGLPLDVFDNSDPNVEPNTVFRVVHLFVGKVREGKEEPVPFMPTQKLHVAYFSLIDGNIKDEENNIVCDNTVIEVAYDLNDVLPPQYRWKILRTRYDKTYNVQQHRKQYGNNEEVAKKIFETIMNPIRLIDLEKLAYDYNNYIDVTKQRVSTKLIEVSKNEDAYYQFKSDLAQSLKKFHNYVKDILFQYFLPKTLKNGQIKKMTVLDFGIGRGGDILKYYHNDIKEVVGIDPDINGLFNASDSAFSRYENQRKKKPYFTQMTFIQASAGELLDVKKQAQLFPTMSEQNKEAIKKNFTGRKFSCINCQFAIHYLFTTEMFANLVKNINTYLEPSGYFIVTTFDANLVKKYLAGEKEKNEFFTDADGNKQILFTIKDVSISSKPGFDQAIDFYTAMYMNEGTYQTEYLVYPEIIVTELNKQCGLNLVESMTFKELMEQQKHFFEKTISTESDPRRKQFLENDVKKFYDDMSSLNIASRNLSYLYRYYVFQKVT